MRRDSVYGLALTGASEGWSLRWKGQMLKDEA